MTTMERFNKLKEWKEEVEKKEIVEKAKKDIVDNLDDKVYVEGELKKLNKLIAWDFSSFLEAVVREKFEVDLEEGNELLMGEIFSRIHSWYVSVSDEHREMHDVIRDFYFVWYAIWDKDFDYKAHHRVHGKNKKKEQERDEKACNRHERTMNKFSLGQVLERLSFLT